MCWSLIQTYKWEPNFCSLFLHTWGIFQERPSSVVPLGDFSEVTGDRLSRLSNNVIKLPLILKNVFE